MNMLSNPISTQIASPPSQSIEATSSKNDASNLSQGQDPNQQQQFQEEGKDDDPNWKAFREGRKKDRAEREAAERRAADKDREIEALKAAMEATFSRSGPSPQAYQQYYGMNQENTQESEDERLDKKLNQLLAKKEEQYKKEQVETERRELPNKLSRDFPDIWKVCSQENLDYLDYHYPEVSRPLQRLPDSYERWHDIYKAICKFVPNNTNVKKDAIRADINQNKPKSISSVDLTHSGEKSRESWQDMEKKRTDRWEDMKRRMNGV